MGKLPTDLSCLTPAGLDLAEHIFFVHVVDAEGRMVVAKPLSRNDVTALFAP